MYTIARDSSLSDALELAWDELGRERRGLTNPVVALDVKAPPRQPVEKLEPFPEIEPQALPDYGTPVVLGI